MTTKPAGLASRTRLPIADVSEVEVHRIIPTQVGGHDDRGNLCLVLPWAHSAHHARHRGDYSKASPSDVPFSGI